MKHLLLIFLFFLGLAGVSGNIINASNSEEKSNLYHPAPIPNFTISHFCIGDTTFFTNTTLMGSSYIWTIDSAGGKNNVVFSQIYTSTNTNIEFVFTHPGTYKISLTANNGHIVTITRIIEIDSTTTANFDYQICGSQFMNMSVCYDSCQWNFGDGHTSTEESPVHFYDSVGVYVVTLIASKGSMSDTITDSVNVVSTNDLNGHFVSKAGKDSVMFLACDSVSGPFTEYHWSFGDGAVADLYVIGGGRKVYHTYTRKDTSYTVFLLVKTTCLNAFSEGAVFVPDSTPVYGTYLYPNPLAGNTLHLATDNKADLISLDVMNYLSQPVDDYNITETTRGYKIDFLDLAQGVYFIRMQFGNGIITRKFIKE
ncbi:MAG: T9SS type A sorting domain-containing protein [Bacteroidetes bacterium]|nr:T9SS type A sorting domain-containing protein [Bacteroidota bacterium]